MELNNLTEMEKAALKVVEIYMAHPEIKFVYAVHLYEDIIEAILEQRKKHPEIIQQLTNQANNG